MDNTCTDCNELVPYCRCRWFAGSLTMPKLDGREVSAGVTLVGEPSPIAGTDKMRCLANVGGALGLVELRLRFLTPNVPMSGPHRR